ncbi:hypothetical protein [Nocardioides antri]|uniref:Hemerythrin domain-containing protein n=1 Tax=Nocardioides antri TaxID=2607659 RepID=A0A5B1M480_9ACTN|nr:hypothetical protein [Nocardioides antri]KAA1426939.1 hypothetical protein F0U47_11520 [Nocardioides antri]
MGSTEVLNRSVQRSHDALAEELEVLRTQFGSPGEHAELDGPHRGYQPIDTFVTTASRHLHAVNEVLVPSARKELPDGRQLAHGYVDSMQVLEVVLSHVKAHEYGSVYEKRIAWPAVWSEVGTALEALRAREEELADQLTDTLDDSEVDELAERLDEVEPGEPSRPHPYLPHKGLMGSVARGIVKRTDRAWDHAEGRPLSWPSRGDKKRPGLLGQYLMADPRFDPDEPPPSKQS